LLLQPATLEAIFHLSLIPLHFHQSVSMASFMFCC